jgi:hypothetical protein
MKDYDPWEKASESEKAKGFEHAKNISQEVRKFVLKLKSRPGGFWMRKGWDTVYIRSWEFGLLQRWKGDLRNVGSLAVDECCDEDGPEIWETLL